MQTSGYKKSRLRAVDIILSDGKMNNVNSELASIKSLLAKATAHVDALELAASSGKNEQKDAVPNIEEIDNSELIDRAKNLLAWGKLKATILNHGTGLFSDSCWNMCLDIYLCDLVGERVTVSSVAHSSGVPMTTAMRYLNVMAEEGLLEKSPNPSDNRMVFVSTSATCREKMSNILANLP